MFLLIFKSQFSIFSEFSSYQIFQTIYLFIIASLLIILFVYDLKHYILPDKILFPAIGIAIGHRIIEFGILNHWNFIENWSLRIENFGPLFNSLIAAILASAFFLAIFLASRGRWMGFGDVKLAFFMGLFLGFPQLLVALFLAFLSGAIIGIALMVFKKRGLKSEIPFGPFLVTGTLAALFFGEEVIRWYLHFAFL
jgi:prepilin signal peptidase PulO-like enzyme (type II secretory pathway)